MTLLITEFHSDRLVFAADRAITRLDTGMRLHGTRGSQKKIREIPRLNGGIGFYGLAEVGATRMTDWIEAFLRKRVAIATLGEMGAALKTDLESAIPVPHKTNRLGFHLAGYNTDGNPELWHITNSVSLNGRRIGGPTFAVSEDFLREHARGRYGYQGTAGERVRITQNFSLYRNGDLRAHEFASDSLDEIMSRFQGEGDFRRIRDRREYLEFKMKFIAFIYKRWSTRQVVGGPIDSFTVRPRRR